MRSTIFLMIIMMFSTIVMGQSKSEEALISSLLEKRDSQIKQLIGNDKDVSGEKKDNLKQIINEVMDYDAMAQIALQETYDDISKEQREEFVSLFSSIIQDQSVAKLDIYRASVSYDSILVNKNSARVVTTAKLDNVQTPVAYTMHKKDSEWLITDMIIDKVSTAASYQRSFQSAIKRKGFDYLLKSLQKRANRS